MKIFTWTKRLFLTLSFLALIATNVLTLMHSAFNATLSGVMSTAFGVQTVYTKHKAATRQFGKRLIRRTKRVATASVAAIPVETIPLLGSTLLIAGTSYELYAACASMKDLDELYSDMGMSDVTPDDVMHSVCNPSLPDVGNLWTGTVKIGKNWWGKLKYLYPF